MAAANDYNVVWSDTVSISCISRNSNEAYREPSLTVANVRTPSAERLANGRTRNTVLDTRLLNITTPEQASL